MDAETRGAETRARDLSSDKLKSFILWRLPWLFIAAGAVWPEARGLLWSLALAWIGSGCTANALRCGRVHCSVMGPSFLFLSLVGLAVTLGPLSLSWNVILAAAGAAVLVGYAPELLGKKYLRDSPAC